MRLPSLFGVLFAALALPALAQVPVTLGHGGYLLDATDTPITQTGVSISFAIWKVASGGTPTDRAWPAAGPVTCLVDVNAGYYAVTLGQGCGTGLTSTHLPPDADRWLEVTVGSTTLSPRLALHPLPAAANADRLAGLSLTDLDARFGTVKSVTAGTGLTGGPITTTGTLSLANTTVNPGTYSRANLTVDAQGRLTAASDGSASTLAGYGIADGVQNGGGAPSLQEGPISSRPAAGTAGRLYVATDTGQISRDSGSTWEVLGRSAADLTQGTLAPARLGSGTPSASTFLRGDGTWAAAGGGSGGLVTLTDAPTVAVDLTAGNTFALTLGGNRVLADPTTMAAGLFSFFVTQDGAGARSLAWGSKYRFGGATPVLSTTIGATDLFVFASNGTNLGLVSRTLNVFNQDTNFWGSGVDGVLNATANTDLCDGTVDGEMCVKQYSSLNIAAGVTVTTAVRRRGLLVYVKGDAVINGTLTMTARGANADPVALGVPAGGLVFARRTAGGTTSGASTLTGAGSLAVAAEVNQTAVTGNGTLFTIARGGASGGPGRVVASTGAGNAGSGGSTGLAGGGGGGGNGGASAASGAGSSGTVFSGGSGGGGSSDNGTGPNATDAAPNGGTGGHGNDSAASTLSGGGGAGNPGGAPGVPGSGTTAGTAGQPGTGGLVILLVRGNLSGSGVISANGVAGGSGRGGGGGSGGGNVLILYGGSYGGALTAQATGGAGGAGVGSASPGGAGGNGSVQGPAQVLP